jgi:hypothetical protein
MIVLKSLLIAVALSTPLSTEEIIAELREMEAPVLEVVSDRRNLEAYKLRVRRIIAESSEYGWRVKNY